MKFEYEEQARRNEPMPDGLTADESLVYTFLRNLYWSLNKGMLSKEQAQKEKNITINKLIKLGESREFERRCWENSAKRTMAAERAMTMYRKNKSLETADELVSRLDWLHDECSFSIVQIEHGANCPICGKYFNTDHSSRKPVYCEDCGCKLNWNGYAEITIEEAEIV